MWMTMVIAAVFFAGMVAILGFGYREMEQDRQVTSLAPLAGAPAARPGHCTRCDAPLRRPSSTDEAVHEIEHRIHAELEDIGHVLRTPESVTRLYHL